MPKIPFTLIKVKDSSNSHYSLKIKDGLSINEFYLSYDIFLYVNVFYIIILKISTYIGLISYIL